MNDRDRIYNDLREVIDEGIAGDLIGNGETRALVQLVRMIVYEEKYNLDDFRVEGEE